MKNGFTQKKEWKSFMSVVVIFTFLAGAQFVLWYFVANSAQNLHERRTHQEQLDNLQANISEIKSTLENQQSLIDQLEVIFPAKVAAPQAIERLENLADEYSLDVEIRSIREESQDNLTVFIISIEAFGHTSRLLSYLSGLEHISELTKIRSWALSSDGIPSGEDEQLNRYRLHMNVLFYMQPESTTNNRANSSAESNP